MNHSLHRLIGVAVLCAFVLLGAACQPAQESVELPTLAVLPSATVPSTTLPPNEVASAASSPQPPTPLPTEAAQSMELPPTSTLQQAAPTEVAAAFTLAEAWFVTSAQPVEVRDCAAATCAAVGTVRFGQPVNVLATQGDWHEIVLDASQGGQRGFIPVAATERRLSTLTPVVNASPTVVETGVATVAAADSATTSTISATAVWTLPPAAPSTRVIPPNQPGQTIGDQNLTPVDDAGPRPPTPGSIGNPVIVNPPSAWTPSFTPVPSLTATISVPNTQPPPQVTQFPTSGNPGIGGPPPPTAIVTIPFNPPSDGELPPIIIQPTATPGLPDAPPGL